jgi:hypothetical protein
VRMGGLEPPRPKAPPPQGGVSTNSTTSAFLSFRLFVKHMIYLRSINRLTIALR